MFLKSLSATEDLEWETVDMSDPDTWGNFAEELDAVFTPAEQSAITDIVMSACGFNQDKIEEATRLFIASQGQEQ